MDKRFTPRPVARWFLPAAVTALILMLLGCVGYVMHLGTDPMTLPLDQRALFEADPGWVSAVLGAASAIGAIGAILIIARRKAAEPLLLLSLAGALVWFAGLFAVPQLRELLSTNDIAAAVFVVAVSWTIFWFARHSRQRGWLR